MVVVVIVLASLGNWQLNRLNQRQSQNDLFKSRQQNTLSAVELEKIFSQSASNSESSLKEFEFRKVTLTGNYVELDRESVVRQRTLMGRPGVWLLTPFKDTRGKTFIINRGWVPRELSPQECRGRSDGEHQESPEAKPPQGEVTLTGILRKAEGMGDKAKCLSKVDLTGYQDLSDPPFPFFVQLTSFDGGTSITGPTPLPSPDRGSGPHLGYAVQWFIFATLVVIVYPAILRKNHRKVNKSPQGEE